MDPPSFLHPAYRAQKNTTAFRLSHAFRASIPRGNPRTALWVIPIIDSAEWPAPTTPSARQLFRQRFCPFGRCALAGQGLDARGDFNFLMRAWKILLRASGEYTRFSMSVTL